MSFTHGAAGVPSGAVAPLSGLGLGATSLAGDHGLGAIISLLKSLESPAGSAGGLSIGASAGGTPSTGTANRSSSISVAGTSTNGGASITAPLAAPAGQTVDITTAVAELETIVTDLQSRAANNPQLTAALTQLQNLLTSIPAGTTASTTLPAPAPFRVARPAAACRSWRCSKPYWRALRAIHRR